MYARVNLSEIVEITDSQCVFRMTNRRVQAAAKEKKSRRFPLQAGWIGRVYVFC